MLCTQRVNDFTIRIEVGEAVAVAGINFGEEKVKKYC